jgi:sarcosine oxidase subunit beta
MTKIILCRCEDVTLHDVERAVAQGYRDLEEIKRYTGFGTGPCQGKECMAPVALALLRLNAGADAPPPAPFTARPPMQPTPMRLFAVDPAAHRFSDDPGDAPGVDDDDHEGGP